jgi:eukaryotic-like serine/threonine-protein kinase
LLTGPGDADEAVALYEDALPVIVESYGARHTTALSTRNNFAMALREVGRLPEAITILREVLADRRALVNGVADAGIADMQQNVGVYLLEAGDTLEALRELRAAAANYAASLPNSPLRVFPNLTLSAVALAQADWAVAEREARTALAALEAGLPLGHFAIEVARCRVGRALLGRGPSSAAAAYLRLAGERLANREATTPYRGECLAAWALLERRLGHAARADSVLAALE